MTDTKQPMTAAEALETIAGGYTARFPGAPDPMSWVGPPSSFQAAMWVWSQKVAKAALLSQPDAEAAWYEWRTANPDATMYEAFKYAAALAARAQVPEGYVLIPKARGLPSVLDAVGKRLLKFYGGRFALVEPVQHTDIERQVLCEALRCLLAAAPTEEEKHG